MRQEEYDLLRAARRAGAKMELELEKVQYMLSGAQHMLQHIKEADPELYAMLDIFRIWTEIRDARKQLESAQELTGRIVNYLNYRKRYDRQEPEEYPSFSYTPEYRRKVAETGDGDNIFREVNFRVPSKEREKRSGKEWHME